MSKDNDIKLARSLLFWIFITILLCLGDPDLLDALIHRIGGWK